MFYLWEKLGFDNGIISHPELVVPMSNLLPRDPTGSLRSSISMPIC